MVYLSEFLTLAAIHLLAVMSPGPDTAIVLNNSFKYGQRVGRLTALGIGCGIGIHVLYSVLGVGFLLHQYSWLQPLIMLLAALYLGYLGLFGILNRGTEIDADFDESGAQAKEVKPFLNGLLTNGLNPKATLFFIALFTSIIAESTPFWLRLGYGFYLMVATFAWFALVATFVGHPAVQKRLQRYVPAIDLLMSVLLCLISVRLLWDLLQQLPLLQTS